MTQNSMSAAALHGRLPVGRSHALSREQFVATSWHSNSPSPGARVLDKPLRQPTLRLGISGFGPQERAALEGSILSTHLPWRTCPFQEADAWLVNGGKVTVLREGNLKLAAGLPTERALNLNLREVDRPIAFSTPLASPDFEPRCTFDAGSAASVHATLLRFDNWLLLLRSQVAIGQHIVEEGEHLRGGVFHLNRGDTLLAVLDFRRGTGAISPHAHPVNVLQARWDKRPAGAANAPPGFLAMTPGQAAWSYVSRTELDLLPARYASKPIYFRRAPKVPLRWLRDSQLLLLRELSAEPATLDGLLQRTSLPVGQIRRDLACLYYAGSVTTTPSKVLAALARQRKSEPCSSSPLDSLSSAGFTSEDLTVPVLLERWNVRRAEQLPTSN